MPTNTYTPIGSVTLATATSEVTFTVPTGYRDLIIVADAPYTGTATASSPKFTVNGLSGVYSYVAMQGGSSGAVSYTGSEGAMPGESNTAATYILQFMDYSATDKHKTVLVRCSTGGSRVVAVAVRIATTDAITSITLTSPDDGTDNWSSGATFNLFGIVA